jgi:hypothetical protein
VLETPGHGAFDVIRALASSQAIHIQAMSVMKVLLGRAALCFLPFGFAERPAVAQFSLQSDSQQEISEASHRMNVHSRAVFEALPSNGSSLVERKAGPAHTCTDENVYGTPPKPCCSMETIDRLQKLANYAPVMELASIIGPTCDCLCGKLGKWAEGTEALIEEKGITAKDYANITQQDGHTANEIKDGGDVEFEQLHVLSHKQVLGEFQMKIEDKPKGGLLNKVIAHWAGYQNSMVANKMSNNLGIWNDKVAHLIEGMTDWGMSNGVPNLVPKAGQPVMDYQIQLLQAKGKEMGDIEVCIEGLGMWGPNVGTLLESHSGLDWGTAGPPEPGKPVTMHQEQVLTEEAGLDWPRLQVYVQGRRKGEGGDVAESLTENVFKPEDTEFWEKKTGVSSALTGSPSDLAKAQKDCWEDINCCMISKPGEAEQYQVGTDVASGVGESLYIKRQAPPVTDIMTIEVAMNFQGRLDDAPLMWEPAAIAEARKMENHAGKNCPRDSACKCGCDTLCGDPFNEHPPEDGQLVTAEQAAVFYYYGIDITRGDGAKYVKAGQHWKWTSVGLTWLAKQGVDLPGADPRSSGPREGENVTPYQLHFLLEQISGLQEHESDIANYLAAQPTGETHDAEHPGYILKGSPGLKPCDVKRMPENRNTAAVTEDELILNKNSSKANDAPMMKEAKWQNRADATDVATGKITGTAKNLNPHDGKEPGYEIPKTMSYADILNYLRYTEKLRKEADFKAEIPVYWLKGYTSWKYNQDVRQLENKYFKNLYITSNAASKIVKKEYDVDNRLTSDVTHIVEDEAKPFPNPKVLSKLKYFNDTDDDSKLGQVHALHANPKENGGTLLSNAEIVKDLADEGRFSGTVAVAGKKELKAMSDKGFGKAIMPGEKVRLKLSTHMATYIETIPKDMVDFFPIPVPGPDGHDVVTEQMLASKEYKLAGYKVKKNARGDPDCDFDVRGRFVKLVSKFNNYLMVNEELFPVLEKSERHDSEFVMTWQINSIRYWADGSQEQLDALGGHWGGDDGPPPKQARQCSSLSWISWAIEPTIILPRHQVKLYT